MELIRDISEELVSSYIDYAMSVIVGRALPDARDGLKPVQRRILYTMYEMGLRHDKPYRKCARVVGECFVKGTLISTPNGLVPIEELQVGDLVYTQEGIGVVKELYIMPKQELIEIELENGLRNICTKKQMFKVLTPELKFVWKKAEEIEEGDYIVLRAIYPDISDYVEVNGLKLDEDLAYILGYFLADGWIDRNRYKRLSFAADEKTFERLIDVLKRRLNVKPSISKRGRITVIRVNSTVSKKILKAFRLENKYSATIKIPNEIFRSPKSVVYAFIAGFLDGDGYIHKSRRVVNFSSISEVFIDQLQILLFSLGIVSSKIKSRRNIYSLEVRSIYFNELIRNIKPFSAKAKDVEISNSIKRSKWEEIPFLGSLIINEFRERHIGGGWYLAKDGSKFRHGIKYKTGIKIRYHRDLINKFRLYRSSAKELGIYEKLERLGSNLLSFLRDVLEKNIYFIRVKSVKKAKEDITYDIQVESEHEFIANGMIVHNCLGKYHPHGDQPVYEALVRMAQDFVMRYPLVDGQGNFGSIDGDSPAAMRYTECRLTEIAEEMLEDIDKDTVDFQLNFDATLKEPVVLPAKFPNLLVNGSTGIAVGMATNIPPHNLIEVCDGIIAYIKNPEISIEELMNYIKGPDFPTGGIIVGRDGIVEAYKTGRGRIVLRGKAEIEGKKIIIKEIPYLVNKSRLIEQIADLIKSGKLEGVRTVRDESDREGIRVVLELRSEKIAKEVLKKLYSLSNFETTFGIINLALVDNEPKILNLKQLIECYVNHRREVIRRRVNFELKRSEERLHIVEGFRKILKNLDYAIEIIRKSKSPAEAMEMLKDEFNLSDSQANAILRLRLQKLTAIEVESIEREYKELKRRVEDYKKILADVKELDRIIIDELEDLKRKYGDERRTKIVERETDLELIKRENVVVITEDGRIRRFSIDKLKPLRVQSICLCDTSDKLLIFAENGRVFWINAGDIPKRGVKLEELIALKGDRVADIVCIEEFDERTVVIVSPDGYVKRTKLVEFENAKRAGIRASTTKIAFAKLLSGRDILIATKRGYGLRIKAEEIPIYGRNSRGVIGIRLREGDEIAYLSTGDGTYLITITENGYVKKTRLSDIRYMNRGTMGTVIHDISKKTGKLVFAEICDEGELFLIGEDSYKKIDLSRIPISDRSARGEVLFDNVLRALIVKGGL